MTNSLFLRWIARVMIPVLLLFSLFLLLRGHNLPGGGFVGGLVAAGSIVLVVLSEGPDEVRRRLNIDPLRAMFYGLLISIIAGLSGLLIGSQFLTAIWFKPVIQGIGKLELGTPALFDVGVYVVVFCVTSAIIMAMAEEGEIEERSEESDVPTMGSD
jgi:multicomponent Na+:H+ antiporter subunit B